MAAIFVLGQPAAARLSTAQLCDRAARSAAQETGVPLDVLRALTRTETGRNTDGRFMPWPWTVNMEGRGKWFDDLSDARAFARRGFDAGARSFDVGCFQINYLWHNSAFSSLEAMFDPGANALYAARFLKSLYDEFGDWSRAAGAYHSRIPARARQYRSRFDKLHAALRRQPASPQPAQAAVLRPARPLRPAPVATKPPRSPSPASSGPASGAPAAGPTPFPLLQAGSAPGQLGSLFPKPATTARPLIGPRGPRG